ncbi:MAG: hypothetical protein LBI27_03520 [Clostridiales bacterium]|nr:hypothetical protein [Clostridiales bacterium]
MKKRVKVIICLALSVFLISGNMFGAAFAQDEIEEAEFEAVEFEAVEIEEEYCIMTEKWKAWEAWCDWENWDDWDDWYDSTVSGYRIGPYVYSGFDEFNEAYMRHRAELNDFADALLLNNNTKSIEALWWWSTYYNENAHYFRDLDRDLEEYYVWNVLTDEYVITMPNGNTMYIDNRDVFNRPIPDCVGFDVGTIVNDTNIRGTWEINVFDTFGNSHTVGEIYLEPNVYNEVRVDFDPMTIVGICITPPYEGSFIYMPVIRNVTLLDVPELIDETDEEDDDIDDADDADEEDKHADKREDEESEDDDDSAEDDEQADANSEYEDENENDDEDDENQ